MRIYTLCYLFFNTLFLVESQVYSNGDSYSSTNHWVVTHAEEAHHLYVSRN